MISREQAQRQARQMVAALRRMGSHAAEMTENQRAGVEDILEGSGLELAAVPPRLRGVVLSWASGALSAMLEDRGQRQEPRDALLTLYAAAVVIGGIYEEERR